MVGVAQGEFFEHEEGAVHRSESARRPRGIQLWRQVVMVVHESLAQQLVRGRDEDKSVRRVGGMNDVEAFAKIDEHGRDEHRHRRVAVLHEIAHESSRRPRCWIAVDDDAVDRLTPALSRPRRRDHGDPVSGLHQRSRLAAHTGVVGIRVVLDQHEHAPTGAAPHCARLALHRGRRLGTGRRIFLSHRIDLLTRMGARGLRRTQCFRSS